MSALLRLALHHAAGGLALTAVLLLVAITGVIAWSFWREVQAWRTRRRVARAWRAVELDREADGIAQAADAGELTPEQEASAAECRRHLPALPDAAWGRRRTTVRTPHGRERGWEVWADRDEDAWAAVMPDERRAA